MIYFGTITSQGQLTIPAAIRRKLGLDQKNRQVVMDLKDEAVIIRRPPDIEDLCGILKTTKRFTRAQERKAWEEAIVEKYKKDK